MMQKTVCTNGDVILTDNSDVEGFELFYSSNNNSFYIATDSDKYANGSILICSDKDGWTGDWGDDTPLVFSQFFNCQHEDETANIYFDIDEEDFFEFYFSNLSIKKINDEYCLCVEVDMHDSYTTDGVTSYILNLNDEKSYKITYDPQTTVVSYDEVSICYEAVFVGSANSNLIIVEDRSLEYEEYAELIKEEEIEYETTDFGFICFNDDKVILDIKEKEIWEKECVTPCLEEDLI